MNPKGLVVILLMLFLSCSTKKEQSENTLSYFTNDAVAMVRINDMARFQSELKNNAFLSSSTKLPFFNSLDSFLTGLAYMNSNTSCSMALYEVGKENFEFLLLTKTPAFFNLEKAREKISETLSYENETIEHINLDGNSFYTAAFEEEIVVSSSQLLLENAIRVKKTNKRPVALQKLYEAADPRKSANFFINLKIGESFVFPGLKSTEKGAVSLFSDWLSLDLNSNQDVLNLSGITVASDSIKNIVSLFKDAPPLGTKIAGIAPLNTSAMLAFSIGDYASFAQQQDNYLDRLQKNDTVFNTVEEIGVLFLNNQKAVILNSYGTNNILTYLNSKSSSSIDYQGSEIKSLTKKNLISTAFTPLVKGFDSNFYTTIENAFVFAENKEVLQTIVSNQRNKATFDQTSVYKNAMQSLANESNMLFVANKSGIEALLKKNFSPKTFGVIPKNYSYAAQLVSDKGFYHTNVLISKTQKSIANNSVSPLFTLELDSDLAIQPQFVKNHRTRKQEIVVQDTDNNLYLISTSGKVLWKKQLGGKIQGKISQVDLYKNGKLQLAFCTNNQFLILDRNGKEVPPFNKKFEGGNLNGLAVFDYDAKKEYRFVVTQGRNIFMYNNKGSIVNGFTYKKAASAIVSAPKHFKVGKKDFLVFQLENGTLKIRHRAGQERIKINEKINFSNNEVFLYKNKFSVTDSKGVLHQVDATGKMTKTNFNLNQDHGMYATSKTLVLMNDNILSIKGKKVELELGVYTTPKIFYIYDKIYVAVTDLQSQKIHLYDSQAKLIANFPVYGSSLIDMIDMDNDRKLELVTKDQENSLIVYKLN